jgi:hypothetical protein
MIASSSPLLSFFMAGEAYAKSALSLRSDRAVDD